MKSLNLEREIKNWEGESIPWDRQPDTTTTLKKCLVRYLRHEKMMPYLSESDRDVVYTLGSKVCSANGQVDLTTEEHRVLEKICSKGEITAHLPNGQKVEELMFDSEVRIPVKKLVKNAPDSIPARLPAVPEAAGEAPAG